MRNVSHGNHGNDPNGFDLATYCVRSGCSDNSATGSAEVVMKSGAGFVWEDKDSKLMKLTTFILIAIIIIREEQSEIYLARNTKKSKEYDKDDLIGENWRLHPIKTSLPPFHFQKYTHSRTHARAHARSVSQLSFMPNLPKAHLGTHCPKLDR